MRVCFISGEYPPMRGGIGDYTRELARALQTLGVEVAVITGQRTELALQQVSSENNPLVIPIDTKWGYQSWGSIKRALATFNPDVVHIQYQTAAYGMHPAINLLPLYLRRFSKRPAIAVTFHDLLVPYLFPKAGHLRRLPAAILTLGSDMIVVTNEDDAPIVIRDPGQNSTYPNALFSRHGGHPVHLIPIGSNVPGIPPTGFARDEWRKRLGVQKDETLLAHFGFLSQSKGTDMLFEALRTLLSRGGKFKLVMIGGTSGDSDPSNKEFERRIRAMADEPLLRPHVIWTGFTTAADVSANIHAADICVLLFREGASLRHGTLVAAIVNEIPIITTQRSDGNGSGRGYLPDGLRLIHRENSYLIEPNSSMTIVKAIEELVSHPDLAAHIRLGAQEMAPLFSWNTIAQKSLDAYNSLR